MKIYFLVLVPVLFCSCIIIKINHDHDVHIAYIKNGSSHNIYFQHYSRDHNDMESGNFFAYGEVIPKNTLADNAAPLHNDFLDKVLMVDTDSRKLLKKITGAAYYNMLTSPEIIVKNNTDGGKTTYYNYYFIITDDFLKADGD